MNGMGKIYFGIGKNHAAKCTFGSVVNAFYNPQVAIKLKNLISYLPLWTGIMRSYFVECKATTIENKENTWNVEENWHGLTIQKKPSVELDLIQNKTQSLNKKRKVTYLDDCPNWDDMKTMKRVIIPLLKSGSLLKAVRCENNFIVVRETCAFDFLITSNNKCNSN